MQKLWIRKNKVVEFDVSIGKTNAVAGNTSYTGIFSHFFHFGSLFLFILQLKCYHFLYNEQAEWKSSVVGTGGNEHYR